ncbi:MAG: hypothetical protein ABIZ80_20140 [Bryobacteraceae bacterium]
MAPLYSRSYARPSVGSSRRCGTADCFQIATSGDSSAAGDFWAQFLSGSPVGPAGAGPPTSVKAGLDAAIDASVPAPATPPNVRNPVLVTFGETSALVSSATLVPGFSGIYELKATAPEGVTGDAIPIVVSVLGKASVPVVLSVR